MNGWSWLGLALALLFVVDGLKLRRRLGALSILSPAPGPVDDTYVLLLAPGVAVNDGDRMAAVAFSRAHGLDALDLLPGRWEPLRAMTFCQVVDPAAYRALPLAPGFTAGHALVVSRDLLAKTGLADARPDTGLAFLRVAQKLKRYAPRTFDFAVVPGLVPVRQPAADWFAIAREALLELTPSVLAGQLLLFALVVATAVWGGPVGGSALLAFQLQPALALAGLPLAPFANGLGLAILLSLPIQLWELFENVAAARPDPEREAASQRLRVGYQTALAQGLDRFFEPRRESCYVCGGKRLAVERRQKDLLQHKPGSFTLERCLDCRHIFQNPRLSLAGLAFYYGDFYDGLGESFAETMFGLETESYLARAHELDGKTPGRWLDVGGGYGHFCLIARDVLPQTHFDCLDMSESVEEGARRGWAERGRRGLFPELAPTFAGEYDVVSLSHCLEHTRDPRAELAAAHVALARDGRLLIEVPDPEFDPAQGLPLALASLLPATAPAPSLRLESQATARRGRVRGRTRRPRRGPHRRRRLFCRVPDPRSLGPSTGSPVARRHRWRLAAQLRLGPGDAPAGGGSALRRRGEAVPLDPRGFQRVPGACPSRLIPLYQPPASVVGSAPCFGGSHGRRKEPH